MAGDSLQPSTLPAALSSRSWTLAAYQYMVRKRLLRQPSPDIRSIAERSWDIAPGEMSITPPAIFLPGQLERVTGWEGKRFYPFVHPRSTMEGGIRTAHGSTRGYLCRDVWLIDGALYKGRAAQWLSHRHSAFPP